MVYPIVLTLKLIELYFRFENTFIRKDANMETKRITLQITLELMDLLNGKTFILEILLSGSPLK